jgi:hypothetical protein
MTKIKSLMEGRTLTELTPIIGVLVLKEGGKVIIKQSELEKVGGVVFAREFDTNNIIITAEEK